jgi:class 3 adenylate cyclase
VWRARALTCRGAVDLHRGELGAAVEVLGRAWRLWQEVGLPYENAQARTLLGRARLAMGDAVGGRLELKAARSTFARLGAKRDLRMVDQLASEAGVAVATERSRETKTFMFTDIVASTDLIAVIGDDSWESLREWHDRSLRECIRRHQGVEVNHTGDGFFVAFDDPALALECAMEIQQRLAEHRREHGFSPSVRIGLHLAETTRSGDSYTGAGVHTAARIGELGDREEIVASTAVLEPLDGLQLTLSEPRTVTLKGVPEPVEVVSVDWR